MENLERCYSIVQQSSAKGGISAIEISKKTGIHRTTIHRHLTSLALMGKVESQQGLWVTKTGEQTIKPLEKEIVIELPMPKNKWLDVARLQVHANYMEDLGFSGVANIENTIIEKFNETRTIKIKGKNVDDLDLEKIGNLIQQATESSSRFSLNNILRKIQKHKINEASVKDQRSPKTKDN